MVSRWLEKSTTQKEKKKKQRNNFEERQAADQERVAAQRSGRVADQCRTMTHLNNEASDLQRKTGPFCSESAGGDTWREHTHAWSNTGLVNGTSATRHNV